ncbi:MAG TPA: type VI secretion system contractile sheath small subunit [Thermoanaerobaculia bacterium]|nr:type VI secretion system contractile sheath small subunit [Thermoanaerobaculia bacterium]
MADDSTQKWLGRNRPPRVQITYDLETGGAIQKKELPLVVGILADLAGDNADDLAKYKTRKFVEIDRDNFDDVMAAIRPTLTIEGETLEFKKFKDFRPEQIVERTKLAELLAIRQNLNDLLADLDGNDSLDTELSKVLRATEAEQQEFREEITKALPAPAADAPATPAAPAEGGN